MIDIYNGISSGESNMQIMTNASFAMAKVHEE